MKFSIDREVMAEPLQLLMGVVDRRQTVPVLSHILLEVVDQDLVMTGSDQELEITAQICLSYSLEPGEITAPARKMFDICRNLSPLAVLQVEELGHGVQIQSGRFHCQLKGLPAHDFPRVDLGEPEFSMELDASRLWELITRVDFAMAHQDVRYFFNGLLLEVKPGKLTVVATNGQRLAVAETATDNQETVTLQAILPRKAVVELLRVLKGEGKARLKLTRQHLSVERNQVRLTTKLIDADYPDYHRAIPVGGDKKLTVDRRLLKNALMRISVLSNELYRNVRLQLAPGQLQLSTHNPMQEEAEEVLVVDYDGDQLEVGFNIGYLVDVLSAIKGDRVQMVLLDSASAVLFTDPSDKSARYVISPMIL
jgi:DNA polymerase-3 subunit beta